MGPFVECSGCASTVGGGANSGSTLSLVHNLGQLIFLHWVWVFSFASSMEPSSIQGPFHSSSGDETGELNYDGLINSEKCIEDSIVLVGSFISSSLDISSIAFSLLSEV